MKTLYEGILGDIDDILKQSDKNVEILSLGMPGFDDCHKSNSFQAAYYIWKLPPKILNLIKDDRDRIFSKYDWLSSYDRTADNIVIYCSTRKFYINLCTDNTIAGIRLIGGAAGTKHPWNNLIKFCNRSFEKNKETAYRLLTSLANKENLKYLFEHGGPESHNNWDDIIQKLITNN